MYKTLINKFYSAFQKKDWGTMQSCYHENATFSDPVFTDLNSKQVKAMWQMLLSANGSLQISYRDVKASEEKGSCHWEAIYDFSKTGRRVHNVIEAEFEFKDGLILRHNDTFSLWKWAGMALGISGKLLGWTPMIRNKIRLTAEKRLSAFVQEHPEYQ